MVLHACLSFSIGAEVKCVLWMELHGSCHKRKEYQSQAVPECGEGGGEADRRGKREQTRKNRNRANKIHKNDFYLCTRIPLSPRSPSTSQPKAKRLITFSRRYAPKNTIRLPSLLIATAPKNDGRIELRFAIIFFPSLFFNLCHDCFIYKWKWTVQSKSPCRISR